MTTPTPSPDLGPFDTRNDLILSSLFYAEKKVGGILTGGVHLEELVTWQRLADLHDGIPHQPITEDELRNLAHEDHGTWRGILGRLGSEPMPFGLATAIPAERDA